MTECRACQLKNNIIITMKVSYCGADIEIKGRKIVVLQIIRKLKEIENELYN